MGRVAPVVGQPFHHIFRVLSFHEGTDGHGIRPVRPVWAGCSDSVPFYWVIDRGIGEFVPRCSVQLATNCLAQQLRSDALVGCHERRVAGFFAASHGQKCDRIRVVSPRFFTVVHSAGSADRVVVLLQQAVEASSLVHAVSSGAETGA